METMTNLSPAAQAVMDAYYSTESLRSAPALAAALRAAADQLGYSNVPEEFAHMRPKVIDVDDLLAITDELEGVKYGTYRCKLQPLLAVTPRSQL
jgi:hypothetical protein